MKIKAYYNRKLKMYSIVCNEGLHIGKVIGWAERVLLKDVEYKVGKKCRKTVLREGYYMQHSYVWGELIAAHNTKECRNKKDGGNYGLQYIVSPWKHVRYNDSDQIEYHIEKHDCFTNHDTPVFKSRYAVLNENGIFKKDDQ